MSFEFFAPLGHCAYITHECELSLTK